MLKIALIVICAVVIFTTPVVFSSMPPSNMLFLTFEKNGLMVEGNVKHTENAIIFETYPHQVINIQNNDNTVHSFTHTNITNKTDVLFDVELKPGTQTNLPPLEEAKRYYFHCKFHSDETGYFSVIYFIGGVGPITGPDWFFTVQEWYNNGLIEHDEFNWFFAWVSSNHIIDYPSY